MTGIHYARFYTFSFDSDNKLSETGPAITSIFQMKKLRLREGSNSLTHTAACARAADPRPRGLHTEPPTVL